MNFNFKFDDSMGDNLPRKWTLKPIAIAAKNGTDRQIDAGEPVVFTGEYTKDGTPIVAPLFPPPAPPSDDTVLDCFAEQDTELEA